MSQVPASNHAAPAGQPSASAMNVALCRAIAAHEPRDEIRGPDHLAEVFLDAAARQSLYDPAIHALILKKVTAFSPGTYEYFIARTAYLDAVVEQALRENIPQIVFLGAGYDTRACRFSHLIRETHLFELDARATQQHKLSLLQKAGVAIPAQVTFVTVDFTSDSLADVLARAGYAPNRRTLFVWEGVTYYLPPQAVEQTLAFIRQHAPAGSVLCFDYMITIPEMGDRFGAKQARDAMRAIYSEEPLQFDLAEDQVAAFLAERGFALLDHATPETLQGRYLTLRDGSLAGQMLDLFRLVQATVVG